MNKTIAAYTEHNDWPAFINVSRTGDDEITILVRDRGDKNTGASNNFIEIKMTAFEFIDFVKELQDEFGPGRPVIPHRSGGEK